MPDQKLKWESKVGMFLSGEEKGGPFCWCHHHPFLKNNNNNSNYCLFLLCISIANVAVNSVLEVSSAFPGCFEGHLCVFPCTTNSVHTDYAALGITFLCGTKARHLCLALQENSPSPWLIFPVSPTHHRLCVTAQ